MPILQENKLVRKVYLQERVTVGGKLYPESLRRLPFNFVKFDNATEDFDVEPFNDGEFVAETGSSSFVIQTREADKGTCIGFEVIDRGVPSAQEFFRCTNFADGAYGATSEVDN